MKKKILLGLILSLLMVSTGHCFTAAVRAMVASITAKLSQTITWNTQPATMTVGDADQTLNMATASSGLAVTYSTSTTSYCTIVAGKLHAVAAGTCVVHADQAGDAAYNAAAQVDSGNVTIGAGGTYLFEETFDGSSACYSGDATYQNCSSANNWVIDHGTPTGWKAAGLVGTYGLSMGSSSAAQAVVSKAFTGQASLYVTWKGQVTVVPPNTTARDVLGVFGSATDGCILRIRDYGGSDHYLRLLPVGGTEQIDGTALDYTTARWYKMYFAKGAGTAVCTLWTSTDGTTWTQRLTGTDGTTNVNMTNLEVMQDTADAFRFTIDQVKVSATDIADAN